MLYSLQVTYDRESNQTADGPKHGKTDEKNDPHVGGNTWAGGTGGYTFNMYSEVPLNKTTLGTGKKWSKKCVGLPS